MALGYAGVALAVLALMLPSLLVMKSRNSIPTRHGGWREVQRRCGLSCSAGSALSRSSLRLSQACCPR
jgi:hypothetical protein